MLDFHFYLFLILKKLALIAHTIAVPSSAAPIAGLKTNSDKLRLPQAVLPPRCDDRPYPFCIFCAGKFAGVNQFDHPSGRCPPLWYRCFSGHIHVGIQQYHICTIPGHGCIISHHHQSLLISPFWKLLPLLLVDRAAISKCQIHPVFDYLPLLILSRCQVSRRTCPTFFEFLNRTLEDLRMHHKVMMQIHPVHQWGSELTISLPDWFQQLFPTRRWFFRWNNSGPSTATFSVLNTFNTCTPAYGWVFRLPWRQGSFLNA